MRVLALLLILLTAPGLARAGDQTYKVGVARRDFVPSEPYDWRGAKTHALGVLIWYPAAADAVEEPRWVGPPIVHYFSAGTAAPNAALAAGPRFPLVVLSHGTGGTASELGWLGTALAAHGIIAVAVNHPGNNALEDYTVEGFVLWWERATDLSAVIDAMLADKTFGGRIDAGHIGAAGHSLGGYTVIAIAGGITDPQAFLAFCHSPKADASCQAPPEFRGLQEQALARLDSDADFRRRFAAAGNSYRDPRVRAVFAMAPALGPVFTPASLAVISIPAGIVAGTEDEIVPPASSAEALAKDIPFASLKLIPGAGHYVFTATCTFVGRIVIGAPCRDPAGTDRDAVQAETARLAAEFFAANLR